MIHTIEKLYESFHDTPLQKEGISLQEGTFVSVKVLKNLGSGFYSVSYKDKSITIKSQIPLQEGSIVSGKIQFSKSSNTIFIHTDTELVKHQNLSSSAQHLTQKAISLISDSLLPHIMHYVDIRFPTGFDGSPREKTSKRKE